MCVCVCVHPCVVFSGISAFTFSSLHVVWGTVHFHRWEITGAECKTSSVCVYDVDVFLQCTTAKSTALYLDAHFREKGADKQQQTWEMLFRIHIFGVSKARWKGMEKWRGKEEESERELFNRSANGGKLGVRWKMRELRGQRKKSLMEGKIQGHKQC